MKYRLVADSSSNILEVPGLAYEAVPLKIVAGEKEYVDNASLDVEKMVTELKAHKGKSSTACPNTAEWLQAFGDAEVVLGVAITSGLSGAYAAGMAAKTEYEETHPGKRVYLCDSLSTGPEMVLILERMAQLAGEEKSYEEIVAEITEYTKHTHLMFSLESLTNFARNGRVNPAVAAVVGVLGIRIMGKASAAGTLEPMHKCRGEKRALETLYREMKSEGYNGGKVRIYHSYNPAGAKAVEALIRADFPEADITIGQNRGLCCYYAEPGGVLVGFEDC